MIKRLGKNKTFMIGFSFISTLMVLSVANSLFNDGNIRTVLLYMDDQANIVDAPPYKPFTHWFIAGSDNGGRDWLHMVIHGAKFTIGVAFAIAFLRVLFSLIIGSILGVYFQKYIRWFEKLADPITVIPLTLVAYYVLFDVIIFDATGSEYSFKERAFFQIAILTGYAVPTLAIFQANEIKKLHHEEFMEAANVLGGSKLYQLKVHILPHLKENLIIILMQQYIQVLVVLAHLGVLGIFFGGSLIVGEELHSVSNEWSGLIGNTYDLMIFYPWLPLTPTLFLGLTILSAQMMLSGMKEVIAKQPIKRGPVPRTQYVKKRNSKLSS